MVVAQLYFLCTLCVLWCPRGSYSTRGSYGSEMPPQVCKHSVTYLILSKTGISMESVTCQSHGRTSKKDFSEVYRVLVGTDPMMPKVRADPGRQGHLKPALPWKLSIRICFQNSELDLQFRLKVE